MRNGFSRHCAIAVVLLSLIVSTALAQTTQPARFLRVDRNATETIVRTSITRYRHASGATVDLVAMMHVGNASYYADIDRQLQNEDAVLFEFVGKPSAYRPVSNPDAIVAQPSQIDYRASQFVQADIDPAEFRLRAKPIIAPSPQNVTELIRALPDVENPQVLSGLDPHFLIDERNRILIQAVGHRLARGDTRIAILYGAAHMPGIDRLLRSELGFIPTDQITWHTALHAKNPPEEKSKSPVICHSYNLTAFFAGFFSPPR